jgi:hypothetical protein
MFESQETAPPSDHDRHDVEANPEIADRVTEEDVVGHGF